MSKTILHHASQFLPTAQDAWQTLELDEGMAGSLTLSLNASAPLHHGDMKISYKLSFAVSGSSWRSYEVEGQELDECLSELVARVNRDKRKAALAISHDDRKASPGRIVEVIPVPSADETF